MAKSKSKSKSNPESQSIGPGLDYNVDPKSRKINQKIADTILKPVFVLDYANNLVSALEIINRLNPLSFTLSRENCCGVRYDVTIYNNYDCTDKVHVCNDSAATAICLAALKYTANRPKNRYRIPHMKS